MKEEGFKNVGELEGANSVALEGWLAGVRGRQCPTR